MLKILIVDDCQDSVIILEMFIKKALPQAQISKAYNGQEALKVIDSQNDFDIIFLDLYMPTMSGFEFLEVYQGNARLVAITATHPYRLKREPSVLKLNSIMIKPITSEEIEKILTHYKTLV